MNVLGRIFPWAVVTLAAGYLVLVALPPQDAKHKFHIHAFASLPAVDGGRVQPLVSVADTSLMIITGKRSFKELSKEDLKNIAEDQKDPRPTKRFVAPTGARQPSIKWLLDVIATGPKLDHDAAMEAMVFRIENDQVRGMLNLPERPGSYRYAFAEFGELVPTVLDDAVKNVLKKDTKYRDLVDNKILELAGHVELFLKLAHWTKPYAVPPLMESDDWQPLADALRSRNAGGQPLLHLIMLYRENKVDEFNHFLGKYQEFLETKMPAEMRHARLEMFFNNFAPFYQCIVLYIWVFVLACLSWLVWSGPLNRAAFWLAALTLVLHTSALIMRMYLQGRPPVTNLYSSAVFIGWGCVCLGLFLEWLYGNGFGNVVASVTGALTLYIAHMLSSSGDTMEMMQAVLDTNFWLATHVTTVTLGYTATFVAGFLGIGYVILGVLTPRLNYNFPDSLDRNAADTLKRMIYGVICFATLLSFVGTVLGGIWADQSWGRFWGWDPKENGALIIVLWNALVLHGRWAGLIKGRGLPVMAIGGNIVTAWSWFGVNMLGVGLHSYGFMSGAVLWMGIFVASQLLLIGLGCLPLRFWGSDGSGQIVRRRPPGPFENEPARPLKEMPRGARSSTAVTSH